MSHPVLDAVASVREAVKAVADVNPTFMSPDEKATGLREVARAGAQLDELRLRLLAGADDLAAETAHRDAAAWLAHHTRARIEDTRADRELGVALDRRWSGLARGLRDGEVSLAQARVIARALDDLPDEVGRDVVARAEELLVAHAADFGPRQLAIIGRRILDVAAPEIAEAVEARRLADLESAARRRTRLRMRSLGDGTTRLSARIPDAMATRLATYLEAFASPRRAEPTDERVPYPRRLGQAFGQLLESIDPARLPIHAGDATTVVVTVPLDALRRDLAAADLVGGDAITAGEARRLACTARILPAVLGGESEILDLGRSRRLHSPAQRKALLLRDRECRAEGCGIPGTWCEAHHWLPWLSGGHTTVDDGVLLCHHHHQRVHDPAYTAERMPDGDVRFSRRT